MCQYKGKTNIYSGRDKAHHKLLSYDLGGLYSVYGLGLASTSIASTLMKKMQCTTRMVHRSSYLLDLQNSRQEICMIDKIVEN